MKNKIFVMFGLWMMLTHSPRAFAQGATQKSEEDDFSSTPQLDYGEFNEAEDENRTTTFYQYGRFFGFSIGAGYDGVTGNRGALWQGGFPMVDVRVHYWFDFHFALQLAFSDAQHKYTDLQNYLVSVDLSRIGIDFKYYFDTQDSSAPLTFANPYVYLGIGNYRKTENNPITEAVPSSNVPVFSLGVGFEFPIRHRSTYFYLEGRFNIANFPDSGSNTFSATRGIADLSGAFYNACGGLLFTW